MLIVLVEKGLCVYQMWVMKKWVGMAVMAELVVLAPLAGWAQTNSGSVSGMLAGLQGTLNQAFQTMLGKSGALIGIGRALAGLGALLFIGHRLWGSLARAEPVDVYGLLRPFGIGLALLFYPNLLGLVNGVLQPTVDETSELMDDSNQAIAVLLKQKEAVIQQGQEWQMYVGADGGGSLQKWEQYSGEADSGFASGLSNRMKFEMAKASYGMRNSFKLMLSQALEILYEAAGFCINTVRVFYLVVLAMLGPLVLGLSVFPGFTQVLSAWLGKYVHVFLWLPVCNIFGSLISQIQVEMIKVDISQLQTAGKTFFGPTDMAYTVFLLMGIVGYFTVPSITNFIVSVFPGHSMHLSKFSSMAQTAVRQGLK